MDCIMLQQPEKQTVNITLHFKLVMGQDHGISNTKECRLLCSHLQFCDLCKYINFGGDSQKVTK